MCGIAGTIGIGDSTTARVLLGGLAHRGPDDEGVWKAPGASVVLGHRRLAILDLSAAGHQPMTDEHESVAVVFNGEIYNYQQLREELKGKGYIFRSTSDTEVLVHGYREWGADIFKKIDGMWAIALYDSEHQILFLSRDPAGIKPLYVYKNADTLLFASEIDALVAALPATAFSIRADIPRMFLAHGYVYGTETIYNEIEAVPPSTTVQYSTATLESKSEQVFMPEHTHHPRTVREAAEIGSVLLEDAVRVTLQSDVPVGLFLSGGVDSSLIGYHLKQLGAPLHAFTVGFEDASFDESGVASRIAQELGLPHDVFRMTGTDVARDVEHILDSFGQPFADMSALPTYYLSKGAREKGCTVALAGDGADELFGGYPTHFLPSLARLYRQTPSATDSLLAGIANLHPHTFEKLGRREKITRFLHGARHPFEDAHALWKRVFTDKELNLLFIEDHEYANTPSADFAAFCDVLRSESTHPVDLVSRVDFRTFLASDCLVKSDISSMQHGVEVRVPFLTKALISFGWHLPAHMKVSPFQTKKVLRAMLAEALPHDIVRMPKQGFVPPLARWLSGELKPAMLGILSPEGVARTGFLDYRYVTHLIDEHVEGRQDHAKQLWALMSLVRFYSRRIHTP